MGANKEVTKVIGGYGMKDWKDEYFKLIDAGATSVAIGAFIDKLLQEQREEILKTYVFMNEAAPISEE
mgnify:CR=1 FL=1